MNHSIDFFKDEIRCGFYVPTAIKQAWASALDVLDVIDKICNKHSIKYYADWGTLLGAVRHGGFIPWDDDLDICMLRDDYEKFRSVADEELPTEYVIHDYERKDDHWLFLSRVVNNSRICFEEEYLDAHNNFPWLSGVDIFVKDYLFADEIKEMARDREVLGLIALADSIREGSVNRQQVSNRLAETEKKYGIRLGDKPFGRDIAVALYKLAEQRMAIVNADETHMVGQIFPWILKNGLKSSEPKDYYESSIRLPFEDTTIPVPVAYNNVLTSKYGNYNKICKIWDGHAYPFFESQKANLEKISGETIPSFKFTADMLIRPEIDNDGSLKIISGECLSAIENSINNAEELLRKGDNAGFAKNMEDSQQLAAEYGTFVEKIKGIGRDCTTAVTDALQKFCDALWEEYQLASDNGLLDRLSKSRSEFDNVLKVTTNCIIDRQEVLFLPIGSKEWRAFDKEYKASIKENADVYVVPLPLLRKSFLGEIQMTDEEILNCVHLEDYPDGVVCSNWVDYDISVHCPDIVFIQYTYDNVNPCLSIPSTFFVENIRRYAKKVIYIPIGQTAEFGEKDVNDLYNMKHYVNSPGVIYADEVLVQSENIKSHYVESLTVFAGKNTESVWINKITVDSAREKEANSNRKKQLVYCIGANELKEHQNTILEGLREKLSILSDENDKLEVAVTFFPDNRIEWDNIDSHLFGEIHKTVDETARQTKRINFFSLAEIEAGLQDGSFDGYYGSPSPLIPSFTLQRKPVMLANYEVRSIEE